MTSIDNATAGEPTILTGSPICPGQNQEGRFRLVTDREYLEGLGWLGLTDDEYRRLARYIWADEQRYRWKNYSVPALTDEENEDHACIIRKSIAILEERLAARRRDAEESRSHAGYELGPREFTLTYSPKWDDYTDEFARLQMRKAIARLCKYYDGEIEELRAVGEVGSNGLSHIHCYYLLKGGRKISDKNFKRAYPYWNPKKKFGNGFQGGHHDNVKDVAAFKGYIEEDLDTTAWFNFSLPIKS